MTYQDLLNALLKMTPEQLQCDLTVEVPVDYGSLVPFCSNEFYPADLKICGIDHGVLDEDHPVIFVNL